MFEPQDYNHGRKLTSKAAKDKRLAPAVAAYQEWRHASLQIKSRDDSDILELTKLLNQYKDIVEPIFDARENSAQEGLQPSILEEFFGYIFSHVSTKIGHEILRQPAAGFIGLIFNPVDVHSLVKAPEYTIRTKDHDFVLGATVQLTVNAEGASAGLQQKLVVPAVAIECKRYLERNMLDECAGTAERIKKATPYCRYIVASEFLKLDNSSPELSVIDEIYILRRQKNMERGWEDAKINPIYGDLVLSIYKDAIAHLSRLWWDPESGLKTGRVFNFPRK